MYPPWDQLETLTQCIAGVLSPCVVPVIAAQHLSSLESPREKGPLPTLRVTRVVNNFFVFPQGSKTLLMNLVKFKLVELNPKVTSVFRVETLTILGTHLARFMFE